jgi:hypothetical protein
MGGGQADSSLKPGRRRAPHLAPLHRRRDRPSCSLPSSCSPGPPAGACNAAARRGAASSRAGLQWTAPTSKPQTRTFGINARRVMAVLFRCSPRMPGCTAGLCRESALIRTPMPGLGDVGETRAGRVGGETRMVPHTAALRRWSPPAAAASARGMGEPSSRLPRHRVSRGMLDRHVGGRAVGRSGTVGWSPSGLGLEGLPKRAGRGVSQMGPPLSRLGPIGTE